MRALYSLEIKFSFQGYKEICRVRWLLLKKVFTAQWCDVSYVESMKPTLSRRNELHMYI